MPPEQDSARPQTPLITRHPGARDWAEAEGITVDEVLDHLDDFDRIQPGRSHPRNFAGQSSCRGARGGHYFHLSLDLPPDARGV